MPDVGFRRKCLFLSSVALLLAACKLGELVNAPRTHDFSITVDSLVPLGGVVDAHTQGVGGSSLAGVTMIWESDNTTIAAVDSTGRIKGMSLGSANIQATSLAPVPELTRSVHVRVRYADIFISRFTDSLTALGASRTLVVSGRNATGQVTTTLAPAAVTFTSRDTSIATVSAAGVVTARNNGTVQIVATYESGPAMLKDSVGVKVRQVGTALTFAVHPANGQAGQAITPAIQVSVVDASGNVVTSQAPTPVTLAFATNPSGATLGGTLTVSTQSGVATFSNVSVSAQGNGYALRAAGGGLTSVVSNTFNIITIGAATKLVFATQPQTRQAGTAFTPAIQVAIQDVNGNTISTETRSITIALDTNPGSATLTGTPTVSAIGGVATFSNLQLDKVGNAYRLRASATPSGPANAVSSSFNITPGTAAKLGFAVQPSNAAVSAVIAPPVQVAIQDALGNTVTTAANAVTLAITTNPGGGTLTGTFTNIAPANGVATFSDLRINAGGAGYVLGATATGLTAATSNAFTIASAPTASQIAVNDGNSQTATAGIAVPTPPSVIVKAANGSPVSGVSVTFAVASGGGSVTGGTQTTNAAGIATVGSWVLGPAAGVNSLTATANGLVGSPVTFTATAVVASAWNASGLSNTFIRALAIAPTSTSTLYAGDGNRIYKTSDGGTTWAQSYFGFAAYSLAIDPTNATTVYAGQFGYEVLKTINGGSSWVQLPSIGASTHTSIAINPANTQVVYVGIQDGWGVYRSTNGGAAWTNVLPSIDARSLAVNPANTSIVFAGTKTYAAQQGGVWRSTDAGATWTRVLTSAQVNAITIDPTNSSVMYAATDGDGIYKSTDGGTSWTVVNIGLTSKIVRAIAIHPTTAGLMYAGTWEGGVFKSTNGGASWSTMNAGLTNTYILTLVIDPVKPSTLYAGTEGGGIFKWF